MVFKTVIFLIERLAWSTESHSYLASSTGAPCYYTRSFMIFYRAMGSSLVFYKAAAPTMPPSASAVTTSAISLIHSSSSSRSPKFDWLTLSVILSSLRMAFSYLPAASVRIVELTR